MPTLLTSFIGREAEIEAVRKYLRRDEVRLLSLVGPPGVGKTRLAITAATCVAESFADGVHFVTLETITAPQLVVGAVADALSIRPVAEGPVLRAVAQHLRTRQVLLVLDNFEQVLDAGTDLLQLIKSCAQLKMLVTSREALPVQGGGRGNRCSDTSAFKLSGQNVIKSRHTKYASH